jgi:pentatricopeptide repeat protein
MRCSHTTPALAAAVDDHRTLQPEHELYSLVDIFTYTTMISQCNSHHQLRRALELVAEMRSRAVPLNVHTYSALLNVCLKANELDLSLDVYAQMLAEGCTPNLVTYNTLLDIYNKTGRWMDALNVMELLQHQVGAVCGRQLANSYTTSTWQVANFSGRSLSRFSMCALFATVAARQQCVGHCAACHISRQRWAAAQLCTVG